jgi:hypothetical protein
MPHPTLYIANAAIPAIGAAAGSYIAVYPEHVQVVTELPRSALTPEVEASLRPVPIPGG